MGKKTLTARVLERKKLTISWSYFDLPHPHTQEKDWFKQFPGSGLKRLDLFRCLRWGKSGRGEGGWIKLSQALQHYSVTVWCRFIASYIRLYNYRRHAHPLGVGQVNCSYIQWGICHQRSAQTLVDHCKLFKGSLMSHKLCDLIHLLYFVMAALS